MKQRSSGFIIGLVVSIVLGFAIITGVFLSLRSDGGLGYEPDVLQATKTGPNAATLNISTYPDSMVCHPDAPNPEITWVSYCSSATNSDGTKLQGTTWELPPNSLITVVVNQYDSASGLYNDFFEDVQGTVGGVAMYNNKPQSHVQDVDIAHTFTIQSQPFETSPLFVSVPLLGVADDAPNAVMVNGNPYPKPNVIQFQFRTGPAGHTYIWHCYVPCGNDRESPYGFAGPMSTTGYMAGTLTVANY